MLNNDDRQHTRGKGVATATLDIGPTTCRRTGRRPRCTQWSTTCHTWDEQRWHNRHQTGTIITMETENHWTTRVPLDEDEGAEWRHNTRWCRDNSLEEHQIWNLRVAALIHDVVTIAFVGSSSKASEGLLGAAARWWRRLLAAPFKLQRTVATQR